MNAFEAAGKNGKAEELEGKLVALFTQENRSTDPGKSEIPATYFQISVAV